MQIAKILKFECKIKEISRWKSQTLTFSQGERQETLGFLWKLRFPKKKIKLLKFLRGEFKPYTFILNVFQSKIFKIQII